MLDGPYPHENHPTKRDNFSDKKNLWKLLKLFISTYLSGITDSK
jgi:hypothetical protein